MGVGIERASGYVAYHGFSTPTSAAAAERDVVGRADMARSGYRWGGDGGGALGMEKARSADRRTGGGGSFMAVEPRGKDAFRQANMREVRDLLRGRVVHICYSITHEAAVRFCAAAGPSARHAVSPIRNVSNVSRLPLVRLRTCLAVVGRRPSANHTRAVTACRKARAAQANHHAGMSKRSDHGDMLSDMHTCTHVQAVNPTLALRRANPRSSVT